MAVNYQLELERELQKNEGKTPRLLLHCCCAPCSSYVLEYLSRYFSIYLLYYNPNISPIEEYEKRKAELERLVSSMPVVHPVTLVSCGYEGETFEETAKGLEGEPEGGTAAANVTVCGWRPPRRQHRSCPATFLRQLYLSAP